MPELLANSLKESQIHYYHEEPYTYETLDVECDGCCEMAQGIDHAADCLKAVLEAIYSGEKLNAENLHRNLEDCAHFLGVAFDFRKELQIERKKGDLLKSWVESIR